MRLRNPLGVWPGEDKYSNERIWRGLVTIAVLAVVLFLTNAAGTVLAKVDSNAKDDRIADQQDQIKGTLVGVCAVPNVNRIFVVDALKRLEQLGLHTDASSTQVTKAFDDSYEELRPVDCKAFLPKEDAVKVCLQYPTTVPDRKVPATTATTEYQPACEPTK